MHNGRTAVMTICGNIDVYTASSVGEAIQSLVVDGFVNVVMDLAAVARVDSSGLSTLVGNSKTITSLGGVMCLVGVAASLHRMLKITNLADYFRIYDTQHSALEDLESHAESQVPSLLGGS